MKTLDQSKKSDEELMLAYYAGDNNSVELLYNRYYLKVFNKCLSFVKNADDAFDLTQDIFMKAFTKKNAFKGHSKFSTWLYAISFNHCVTMQKKQLKSKTEPFELMTFYYADDNDLFTLEEQKEREEQELKLYKALDEIPEQDKKLLELKYHNNYSVQDIQTELKISKSAIKMRLMRARQKVGKYYYSAI
ncbi:RNA polymerase sigma factor [Saccharicrinis fermentans]|uniref:Sigma-24 n=1 Tax=Saccharicrinis fermentans DSM 9555 = JCM 21142 TaxID=869213 RepID=W7Y554_9BACT|nr:RNA polymerase sigma factor [Saccharicrinis fermentans]GAF03222.1 sigma-24 [Saccharicrinis fermentans DSM 9555 = JCM 21142]